MSALAAESRQQDMQTPRCPASCDRCRSSALQLFSVHPNHEALYLQQQILHLLQAKTLSSPLCCTCCWLQKAEVRQVQCSKEMHLCSPGCQGLRCRHVGQRATVQAEGYGAGRELRCRQRAAVQAEGCGAGTRPRCEHVEHRAAVQAESCSSGTLSTETRCRRVQHRAVAVPPPLFRLHNCLFSVPARVLLPSALAAARRGNSAASLAHDFQSLAKHLQNKVGFSLLLVGTSMGTTGTVKFMAWLVYHTVGGIL